MSLLSGLFSRLRGKPRVEIVRLGLPTAGTILDDTGKPYADQRRSSGPDVCVHGLYALKGDRIVCDEPAQHHIATFNRDVWIGEWQDPEALTFDGIMPAPAFGTPERDCLCPCGGHWFAGGNYHFKDGWR